MITVREKKFWNLSPKETADLFETNLKDGLSKREAKKRLLAFGKNTIESTKKNVWLKILFNQLKSPLILVLILAGIVTLFIAHYGDALFIFIAVIVNTILGSFPAAQLGYRRDPYRRA